mmetsp:Transcript_11935/g.17817  ORF Transcript_11935/g.17817 Transcript_11935/m.17817 type:complete len:379 (-) Transcript_11935:243-1379(-)
MTEERKTDIDVIQDNENGNDFTNDNKDSASGDEDDNIRQTRRRLSVVSDNKLIEGVGSIEIEDEELLTDEKSESACKNDKSESNGIPKNVVTRYAGFSKRGYAPYNPRKKNQDALVMAEDPATGSLLFVVMDGHGEAGDKVAQVFKRDMAPTVFSHSKWATDIETALRDSINKIELEMLSDSYVDSDFSGSTMVAACVRGNTITIANVGDSRAVLGIENKDGTYSSLALSIDHKPDVPLEKERIIKSGGRVFAVEYEDGMDGPPRVWLGHMDVPGLAMSRSLGDKVAHTAGVSSEPDFTSMELDPNDGHCMLLIATDGLWEFMSNDECVEITAAAYQPRLAVESLITEAGDRWMKEEQVVDDSTVCVAFLGGWAGKSK